MPSSEELQFGSTLLSRLSAVEVQDGIRSGKFTVQQYARDLIRRYEDRDGDIHAWVYFDKQAILSRAKALDAIPAEARGPLHGVAIGIKDNLLTRDMPTRFFSSIHENDGNSAFDSAAVGILRASGALLLGKTATTELACTMVGGPCINPRSVPGKIHSPGGSSSGSAAAVADGQVPIALGTQTAGSIVRPGSFCGVWAFKPTWGLISNEGVSHCAVTCDTVGFFARNIDDLGLLAQIYRLNHGETGEAQGRDHMQIRGARIAMIKTHVWDVAGQATKAAWQLAEHLLATAGAHVTSPALSERFAGASRYFEVIAGSEIRSSFLSRYLEDKDNLHETLRSLVERRQVPGKADILDAHNKVAALRQEWDNIAAEYDAVITPSVIGEAPEGLENTGSAAFNTLWTMLHAPTLNVPGFEGENGMPVGLTLVGGRYTDMEVLRAGQAIGEILSKAEHRG